MGVSTMNIQSLEQVCIEACLNVGIEYKSVPFDGEWYSTRLLDSHKNNGNGRIKIFSDLKGGIAFNWVTGQSQNFFVNRMDGGAISEQDREKIKTDQKRRKAERKVKQDKVAVKARSIFSNAIPAPLDHLYLLNKQIKPYFTRQADWEIWELDDSDEWRKIIIKGVLLIPIFNTDGIIRNLQAVFPFVPLGLGRNKDFLLKAELSGLFCWIGGKTETVCICEGFATGATIHEETGFRVFIAFFKDNLKAVAKIIRQRLPSAKIIICADNDTKTKGNPGVTKANEAAKAINALVAVPPIAGDFNDYAIYLQGAK